MSNEEDRDAGKAAESAAPGAESVADKAVADAADPIAVLEKEKADLRERMLRVAAEFDNWKKRSRKDLADAQTKGKELILRDLLEVVDNLERAVASVGEAADAKAIRDGVNLVVRLFQSKLERHEVRPVESKGKPFDPRTHEAVSRKVTGDVPPGHVFEELTRGYMIGDRLLRPAHVVVAAAPPAPGAGGDKPGAGLAPATGGGSEGGSSGSQDGPKNGS